MINDHPYYLSYAYHTHNRHSIKWACVSEKSHSYNTVFFKEECIFMKVTEIKQIYHFQLMSSNTKHIHVFSVNVE